MDKIEILNNMKIGKWYWSDFTRNLRSVFPKKEEYQEMLRNHIIDELRKISWENVQILWDIAVKINEMIEWDWEEWQWESGYWRSKSEESFNYLLD